MTVTSKTITIRNTDYQKLATLAGITLTNGNSYSIQVQNLINWKVGDAEFVFSNKEFSWKQGTNDVYVKTPMYSAVVTILENE